jgi:hypothetical protein
MQAAARLVNRPPPVVPAAALVQRLASSVQCQSLRVSSPADPAELEARRVARSIVNMPATAPAISRSPVMPQRAETAATAVASPVLPGGGGALPESVRSFMEPRFRADFSRVRIHTDGRADAASRQIQARAFTVGERIYFAGGQFRPETAEGRELIAHELTHTIQQGAAPQAIQRSPETAVSERSGEQLQRWGLPSLPNPRQYIAGKASSIRGFDFMTMVIGSNPITDARVDSSPAGLLREGVKLMPGGGTIAQALDNHQIFDKAGAWISGKFAALKKLAGNIKRAVGDFIEGIEVDDMLNPGAVWQRGKALLLGFVDSVGSYVGGLVEDVVSFIKDAILKPIAAYARGTQGYPLLCSVLGKDPISGDKAPQDADAYLGGFMTFIGEQETWGNMKKANAVPRAFAWFKGAARALQGFVQEIPTLFVSTLKSLGIADLVFIPRAFIKLGKVFAGFAGRFIGWGANAVFNLLEIVLDSVKPGLMGYVRRTGGAIKNILRNPAPFAGNLVRAGIQGFRQFAGNFVTHLKAGLLEWLTGAMPGVHIPARFELKEILRFVLSVLGISWKNIRAKLVRLVGEGPVKAMETGFDIVLTLVRDGPAAAWDKIKEQLGSLKDMVIGGITSFVVDTVVKKAIPKVVAMFVPGAGFIAAAISIYDTIMVFVSKLARIAAVVGAFVSSIAQIAAGNIAGAAKRIEGVLAGLLSLTISFLAGFAGLGKVADKVMGVIAKVRAPIDKALDWLVNWIVTMAKKLFAKAFGKDKGGRPDERTAAQKQADLDRAIAEAGALQSAPGATTASVRQGLPGIRSKYRLAILDLVVEGQDELEEFAHVFGRVNPGKKGPRLGFAKDGTVGPLGIERKMLDWDKKTIAHFTKDKLWKTLQEKPGDFAGARLDIRHRVSISDTIRHTDDSLKPKKPAEAASLLAAKNYPPVPKKKKLYDKGSIVTAARNLLQDANNDLSNLFLGVASVNRLIGKRYDPGDGGNAAAAKHDAQKAAFIGNWGFDGEMFNVTIERKSKKRGTEDVLESWEIS